MSRLITEGPKQKPVEYCSNLRGDEKMPKIRTTLTITGSTGDRGGTVVRVLRYKLEGRSFDSKWGIGIFH
jgi:hypothetical protein